MSEPASREHLAESITTDAKSAFSAGRWNHMSDLSLSITGVLASLVATVLAATQGAPPWALAAVAAMPAACTSLQRVVDFRDRAVWYFLFAARARALGLVLTYAKSPDVEEFARKRAELEVEMEEVWSKIGPAAPDSLPAAK